MRPRAWLLLLLSLAGCASPPEPTPRPAQPRQARDPTPAIVMRGDGVARDRRPPERVATQPVVIAGPALEFEPAPDDDALADDTGPRTLPVVLGETAGLRLFGKVSAADGAWTAEIEVRNPTVYEWAGVDLELTLLDGRRAVGDAALLRVGHLPKNGSRTQTVGGALPEDGVDRVRLRVVEAEPEPGEREVTCRFGRLRNFEVREARLLRTRDHELDAILDLAGGPFEHVPWATADFEVDFLDERGAKLTLGTAQLVRGAGPPWRLHVVGAARSKRQVAAIELRCTNVH